MKRRMTLSLVLTLSVLLSMVSLPATAQGFPTRERTANGTNSVPATPSDCAAGENCYRLRVRCTTDRTNTAIPRRFRPHGRREVADVVIRESGVNPRARRQPSPIGGVVFFTGGYGTSFYGNGIAADESPRDVTVTAVGMRYTTFEVKWLDADPAEIGSTVFVPDNPLGIVDQTVNPGHGFVSGAEGYGAKIANCGVREVIEWISTNRTPSGNQKVCATGNSGGGVQIAYALAVYGAADYLKSAVITGGPSYASIFAGCFYPEYNNGLNDFGRPDGTTASMTTGIPSWHPGRQFLEATMGWAAGTCVRFHAYSADAAKEAFAHRTSLVAIDQNLIDVEYRAYAPTDSLGVLTNQFFVRGSMDNTGAQIQGNTYIGKVYAAGGLVVGAQNDVISANGGRPPDYLQHDIYNTPAGATKIRNFLTTNDNCTY